MRMAFSATLLAVSAGAALAGLSGSASAAPIVVNFGFQRPNLSGGFAYGTSLGSQGTGGWTFNPPGSAGIAANGSGFNTSGADTVSDTDPVVANASAGQAGLMQGAGSISQAVSGFDGKSYVLQFLAEGRNGVNGSNPFTVSVGTTTLTYTPLSQSAIGT